MGVHLCKGGHIDIADATDVTDVIEPVDHVVRPRSASAAPAFHTRSKMERLPGELLAAIISHLEFNEDFANASLVSTKWKAPAQECLWDHINFDVDDPENLLERIRSSPAVYRYTTSTVDIRFESSSSIHFLRGIRYLILRMNNTHRLLLPEIWDLKTFKDVKDMEILQWEEPSYEFSDSDDTPSLNASSFPCFSLKNLIIDDPSSMNDQILVALLKSSNTTLQKIHFISHTIEPSRAQLFDIDFPYLTQFTMETSQLPFANLRDYPRITHLICDIPKYEEPARLLDFSLFPSNIKELALDISYRPSLGFSTTSSFFDAIQREVKHAAVTLPLLRTLKLEFERRMYDFRIEEPSRWIRKFGEVDNDTFAPYTCFREWKKNEKQWIGNKFRMRFVEEVEKTSTYCQQYGIIFGIHFVEASDSDEDSDWDTDV